LACGQFGGIMDPESEDFKSYPTNDLVTGGYFVFSG
jgi:hypothetical protein